MMLGFIRRKVANQISLALGVGLAVIMAAGFLAIFHMGKMAAWIAVECADEFSAMSKIIMVVTGGMFLVGVALTMLLTKRYLGGPLSKLLVLMGAAEKGNFLVRSDIQGDNEISRLGKSFNKMLVTITDLYADRLEKERDLFVAQEEHKYHEEIERRRREVEEANQALEKRVAELSLVFDVGRTVNSTLELEEILSSITEMIGSKMGYQQFVLLLMNEDGTELQVKSYYGFEGVTDGLEVAFKKGEGITWIVAETGQYLLIPDTSREPKYLRFKGRQKDDGVCLSIPMKHQDRCVGVMTFLRPLGYTFLQGEIDFLSTIANQAAVAIVNARLHQKTVEMSITDTLTGVYNRRYFDRKCTQETEAARRYLSPVSFLMIDFDHFKMFNDLNGHTAGDWALRKVASTLINATRRVDIVARYGGEEFCLILPNTSKDDAREVAGKLRRAVESERISGGTQFPGEFLTISIGVGCFPEDGETDSAVLEAADKALYHAKRAGRNRVVAYSGGMEMPGGGMKG
jgi:diguanylate cyclase (GGDEF)-like protein